MKEQLTQSQKDTLRERVEYRVENGVPLAKAITVVRYQIIFTEGLSGAINAFLEELGGER